MRFVSFTVVPLFTLLLFGKCCHDVTATWSIVAADLETLQLGVATATCIAAPTFYQRYFDLTFTFVPQKGALVAQALLQTDTQIFDLAQMLLQNDTDPSDIITTLTSEKVDGEVVWNGYQNFQVRQYGLVNFEGRYDAYTGAQLGEAYDSVGLVGSEQSTQGGTIPVFASSSSANNDTNRTKYVYSVQGNVVEPGTVAASAKAFQEVGGGGNNIDLTEALLQSMEAGAEFGDIRCRQYWKETGASGGGSKSSTIGYIKVIDANGTMLVNLRAISDSDDQVEDAVALLRSSYDVEKSETQNNDGNSTDSTSAVGRYEHWFLPTVALGLLFL